MIRAAAQRFGQQGRSLWQSPRRAISTPWYARRTAGSLSSSPRADMCEKNASTPSLYMDKRASTSVIGTTRLAVSYDIWVLLCPAIMDAQEVKLRLEPLVHRRQHLGSRAVFSRYPPEQRVDHIVS